MKSHVILLFAPAIIIAAGFGARSITTAELNDQYSIFDDFEQTDSLWLFSDKIGAASASGVERAKVAIAGPLGLSSQEAVYFVAVTDNEGRALSSKCDYHVTSGVIDRDQSVQLEQCCNSARGQWELEHHNIPNTSGRHMAAVAKRRGTIF
jgi:hypothetical protein